LGCARIYLVGPTGLVPFFLLQVTWFDDSKKKGDDEEVERSIRKTWPTYSPFYLFLRTIHSSFVLFVVRTTDLNLKVSWHRRHQELQMDCQNYNMCNDVSHSYKVWAFIIQL
jgi:hypothetical protein